MCVLAGIYIFHCFGHVHDHHIKSYQLTVGSRVVVMYDAIVCINHWSTVK